MAREVRHHSAYAHIIRHLMNCDLRARDVFIEIVIGNCQWRFISMLLASVSLAGEPVSCPGLKPGHKESKSVLENHAT